MIEVKKGENVIVKGFTGIKLGVFQVTAVDKKTFTVTKKNGDELVFDRKSGKQINVEEGKEKYANSAMEDDGSYVAPSRGKKAPAKKSKKVETKKAKSESEADEDDETEDEDEEDEEPVKKSKKTEKKAKKTKKVVEEDDDDFEDMDD